ncbi:MAG: tRNA (uridine(34)/cytosine(34)/5-carboxymethylaminomethyluridine(34)-2'-O)-methyltransferase TrmL [Dehalococcoidia bacterium]|nr:tRNA (uridine(34)/cytosine(34)/5-carboxymethylaminomethyluridine(34)-2'-O)-methyltransferase TrmL [Dehalococcoidia bacterium]
MTGTPTLNIVLYQPEIPYNTGNIIRLCKNTGATLHVIKPLGFQLQSKLLKRAALDYGDVSEVIIHDSITSLLSQPQLKNGCGIYATTTASTLRYTDVSYQQGDYVLFGPESGSLPADITQQLPPKQLITIPMMPTNRSLNLSNAVAVILYEAWKQQGFQQSG